MAALALYCTVAPIIASSHSRTFSCEDYTLPTRLIGRYIWYSYVFSNPLYLRGSLILTAVPYGVGAEKVRATLACAKDTLVVKVGDGEDNITNYLFAFWYRQ